VIDIAFAGTNSDYATLTFAPNNETVAAFQSDVQYLQSQGKKVLLSIGGQNGTLTLTSAAQKAAFITSLQALLDQYNFDGFDLDLEGGTTLQLDNGDNNFMRPATPKVVNLISAAQQVISYRQAEGKTCWLTMAPETFFVQIGFQFYGPGTGGGDPRTGAYLPVINALRGDLTILHVQDYNSGPVMGLDNQFHFTGGADFHIAMTDMLVAGFPVANTGRVFAGLRPDQIGIGLPAATSAGNGFTPPAQVQQALGCLVRGQNCGGYTLHAGPSAALRGLMTWSINWDRFFGFEFMNSHRPFLDSLP